MAKSDKAENEIQKIQSQYEKSNNEQSSDGISNVKVLPKRIIIGKPVRATEASFECINNYEVAQLVFGVVCLFFHRVKSTPNEYGDYKLNQVSEQFSQLTAFVNQYETNEKNKLLIIKDFETYLVDKNFSGINAHHLLSIIKSGQSLESITPNQVNLLLAIEKATKLIPLETIQKPLTAWFSQIHWLQSQMAEAGRLDVYQRLGSARLLMQSFNYTVAELMDILQEVSRDLSETLKLNNFDFASLHSSINDKNKLDRTHKIQREILHAVINGNSSVKQKTLEALIYDFCPQDRRVTVQKTLKANKKLGIGAREKNKYYRNFYKAVIFDENFFEQLRRYIEGEQVEYPVSKAEEICFYWLNCAQTVQASDARNLSYQDFVFHGSAKRTTHLSCDYYKSRAQSFKKTDTLDTSKPIGKVLLRFLENRKNADVLLSLKSNEVDHASLNFNGTIFRMLNLLSEGGHQEQIYVMLKQHEVSSVFLDLINCITKNGGTPRDKWVSQRKINGFKDRSFETYISSVQHWLPTYWFTGSMIKTASVHADSSNLRVGTLVNYNSHSSNTEYKVYLSEQNEEHMNMSGRLMRFVMEDIEQIVFKPNLDEVKTNVSERLIRTKIITEVPGEVHPINASSGDDKDIDEQGDSIRVIDSVETVVSFLHYMSQAEKHYKSLAIHNPDYLEKSVLVEAEWREVVLNNLISKKIKTKGFEAYEKYKKMLPELFLSQIEV